MPIFDLTGPFDNLFARTCMVFCFRVADVKSKTLGENQIFSFKYILFFNSRIRQWCPER